MANISPLSRVGAYIVGYNLGILFFEFRKHSPKSETIIFKILSKRKSRVFLVFLSLMMLGGFTYLICSKNDEDLTYLERILFCSFHFLIPLTIGILIAPPLFGFKSCMKVFLESTWFGLLSKLSMSAYGVHFVIQITTIYSRKTDLYINNVQILFIALYSLIPIFAISICFTTLLEMPLFAGKKLYLKTPRITYFEH